MIGKIIVCELDAEARDALTMHAYRHWEACFDAKKQVERETSDRSPDWHLFHASRIATANREFAKAQRVLDQIQRYSPLVLKE